MPIIPIIYLLRNNSLIISNTTSLKRYIVVFLIYICLILLKNVLSILIKIRTY